MRARVGHEPFGFDDDGIWQADDAAGAWSVFPGNPAPAASGAAAALTVDGDTAMLDGAIGLDGATAAQVQEAVDDSGLSETGAGIKVGVLSDSFNDLGGAATDEADGALPSTVTVLEDDPSGGTDEGRAMLQIVHDIAPGASLYFYTAFESEQDFADGILALAAAGCKVICDDVSYYDEPFFQDGIVAQAIETVEQEGVIYVTAAGNNASDAYQSAWTPITTTIQLSSGHFSHGDTFNFIDAENFGTPTNPTPLQTITVGGSSSDTVPLLVEWNQPYGEATSDIAILVFQDGQYLGDVTNADDGEPDNPWVGVAFAGGQTYQIALENLSGPDPTLIKEIGAGDGLPINFHIPVSISGANVGSIFGHAMTPDAITVGAVSSAQTPAFGVDPPVSESFSSSGAGTELLFDDDGNALATAEALSPVDVSGVDDINTTISGNLEDFYGTSAATPSVAATVALMLQEDPNLTPAQVSQILAESALAFGNSAVSGSGLVQADAAVALATDAENAAGTYDFLQFDAELTNSGYVQATRAQTEDDLQGQGYFSTPSSTIVVATTPGSNGMPSTATVLIWSQPQDETVQTGPSSPNPDLRYIIDSSIETVLTIAGNANTGISLTDGIQTVSLQDSGNDILYTGAGPDSVDASASTGADSLYAAGSGDATITGGSGEDVLVADAGSGDGELISGSTSVDNTPGLGTYLDDISATAHTLIGGAGADSLYVAGTGGDLLEAGAGKNLLVTYGTGSNSLLGSTGLDSLYATSSGNDTLHGGSGENLLVALNGSGGGELISGSSSADNTPGLGNYLDDLSPKAHTLQGGAGADTIYVAGSGGDLLEAGSGNNLLATYGSGSNSVVGGTGLDSLYATSSGSDTLHGGSGQNLVVALNGSGGGELISGSSSADTAGLGNYLDDLSTTAHTLIGGAGADTIYVAGDGGDLLEAGSGSNLLVTYGSGSNSLLGGSGLDSLYATSSGSDTLHGGAGNNLLVALASAGSGELISGSSAGNWNYLDDYSATAHTLQGGAGADSLYGNNSAGDTLVAGSGNDQVLQVFSGNNSLQAGSGSGSGDSLAAGAGDDTLNGSANTHFEALFSGTGNSTLQGGSAAGDYFGIKSSGDDTVNIVTGTGSTLDYVDFTAGADFASSAVTSGLPASGATASTITLTFGSGAPTVEIAGNAGTTIELEFTDKTVSYNG